MSITGQRHELFQHFGKFTLRRIQIGIDRPRLMLFTVIPRGPRSRARPLTVRRVRPTRGEESAPPMRGSLMRARISRAHVRLDTTRTVGAWGATKCPAKARLRASPSREGRRVCSRGILILRDRSSSTAAHGRHRTPPPVTRTMAPPLEVSP
jgi:hypothetical protein